MAAACNAEVASLLCLKRDGCVEGCSKQSLEEHDVIDRRRSDGAVSTDENQVAEATALEGFIICARKLWDRCSEDEIKVWQAKIYDDR